MSSSALKISSTASSETSTLRASSRGSLVVGLRRAFRQRTRVEAGRVERLQDVVAGGGEKSRLGEVGVLRLRSWRARAPWLRRSSSAVRSWTRRSSRSFGRRQLLLGATVCGDVGIGRDDAAVGKPRRADFEHALGRGYRRRRCGCIVIEQALDALGDEIVGSTRAVGAARGVEANDLVEPDAGTQQRRGQIEEIGEFAVPAGQREIGVEDGDALARVIERVLQLIAARLDRRRGVVEQFQRRLAADRARPQQQREHETRRRRADRRRQQMFGVADRDGRRPRRPASKRAPRSRMKPSKARLAREAPR